MRALDAAARQDRCAPPQEDPSRNPLAARTPIGKRRKPAGAAIKTHFPRRGVSRPYRSPETPCGGGGSGSGVRDHNNTADRGGPATVGFSSRREGEVVEIVEIRG